MCDGSGGMSSVMSRLVSKDLYRPRYRPEGDVVVDLRQLFNLFLNSPIVISAGSTLSSVATLHASRRAWHCGMESIEARFDCPFRMACAVMVSAAQLTSLPSGASVNGVPWACPKCPRFRIRI